MSQFNSNESYDKIIEFWKSFFPEINSAEEFNRIISIFFDESIEEIAKLREKDTLSKKIIGKYFPPRNVNIYLKGINNQIQKEIQWVYFFEPIVNTYFTSLYKKLSYKKSIENIDFFMKSILSNLYKKLVNMAYRVIVLEISIAKEDERLKGETSVERGKYYCDVLLRDNEYLKEIYEIYPELIRLLDKRTKNYFDYIDEIIANIEQKPEIESAHIGKIKNIEIGQGDTHNKGRSVAKIIFEKVIFYYKPRSLDMECKYSELQNWLKENNKWYHMMKCAKVINFDSFGLMEKIENSECRDMNDIHEFYYQMGQLLCILLSLNSKDFHCENIIASGYSPIPIDLETFVHVVVDEIDNDNIIFEVNRVIQDSVIGTSLLPTLLPNMNTEEVIEVGAMGKAEKQSSPFKTQILKNIDTDDVQIEFVNKDLPFALNYPRVNGKIIGCSQYLSDVRKGFSNLYIWITENKELYMNEIKTLFMNTRCRVIAKNTNIYTQLVETGYHPDLLHNQWDRKIYFCRLGMLYKDNKNYLSLYRDEYYELLEGDIPIYTAMADKGEIYNSSFQKIFSLNATDIAMNKIQRKIEKMGNIDYQRQIALINHSFMGCKIVTDVSVGTDIRFDMSPAVNKTNLDKKYSCAETIATLSSDRGIKQTRDNKKEIMWIGMRGFGKDFYSITPVGLSLYQGNSGVSLFYSALYTKTKQMKYREMEMQAFLPVLNYLKLEKYENIEGMGAFTGFTSYIYCLLRLYKYNVDTNIDSRIFNEILNKSISYLQDKVLLENNMDLLSGLAGVLGVCLSIYHADESGNVVKKKVWELIVKIVEILVKDAKEIDNSCVTWCENGDIGYAHGNAGIITQLARYYGITHDIKLKRVIDMALNYERKYHFESEKQIWTFRQNVHYFSWCNGIAGLLLEKVILLKCGWDDSLLYKELRLLIEQLKSTGFGTDISICHGDMGSIQILIFASAFLNDKELYNQCENTKSKFVDWFLNFKLKEYKCLEDWGIMTGITGIGMSLIDNENQIVDILCLM